MKCFQSILALLAFAVSVTAYSAGGAVTSDPTSGGATRVPPTEGEVRKVDPEAKKITIKHGELKNLDMPAMTMVFQVKDPSMVEQVKPGDKVRFRADKVNGAFTVMEIEVIK